MAKITRMLDAVLYRLLRKIKDFAERQAKKKPPCGDLIFILMVRRPDSLINSNSLNYKYINYDGST
ncbi:TPA: hypothetical protein ACPY4W_003988, partial [Yersinia enterocolitica]